MATIKSLQTTTTNVLTNILENPTSLTTQIGESSPSSLLRKGLSELASWNANIAAESQTGFYETNHLTDSIFTVTTYSYTAFFIGTINESGSNITRVVISNNPLDSEYVIYEGSFNYSGLPFITPITSGNITYIKNQWILTHTTAIQSVLNGNATYSNDTFTGTITQIEEAIINSADDTWVVTLVKGNSEVSVNIFNPNLVTINPVGAITELKFASLNSTGSEIIDSLYVENITGWSLDTPLNQVDLNLGNDTFELTGSVGSSFNGGTGNDSFYISLPDNDIDGGDGIDTAVIGNSHDIFKFSKDGTKLIITSNIDGTKNSISDIERIQFSDKAYALDINGNAGAAAKAIIATFGAESLNAYMVPALSVVDGGMSLVQVCDLVVNNQLIESVIGSNSNGAFVDHVYENVVGVAPSQEDHDTFTALLDDGTYTKSSLLSLAATLTESLVTANSVDLIGVAGSADGEILALQYDLGLG